MECLPSIHLNDNDINLYLLEVTKFLAEYSWIYNVKNTHIFVTDVLEKIPEEWKEPILALNWKDLHEIPFGLIKEHWPPSLKSFLNMSNKLGAIRFPEVTSNSTHVNSIEIPEFIKKSTPRKKLFEIRHVAALISSICKKFHCSVVLDIGSGLGYLDQVLHHNFGLVCVGVDSGSTKTSSANLRLTKGLCNDSILHETLFVEDTEDCLQSLRSILHNVSNSNRSCSCSKLPSIYRDNADEHVKESVVMVGLHCCGKLANDMMKLFCNLTDVKAFVCLGCCYHVMKLSDFPISTAAGTAIKSAHMDYPSWSPCTSGLRLGAQGTRAHWVIQTAETHSTQEQHLIYRAVIENYIKNENLTTWRKPKRRIRSSCSTDFKTYCAYMLNCYEWTDDEMQQRLENLTNLYHSKEHLYPDVKILMILQVLLQPVWEAFVTLDRMMFLKENFIDTSSFILWDDFTSPRNIAICGFKT